MAERRQGVAKEGKEEWWMVEGFAIEVATTFVNGMVV